MSVDKADGTVDGETELTTERRQDRPPPPDRPGAEGLPSRADSRREALAANERLASAEAVSSSPTEEIREVEQSTAIDGGEVSAADGIIDHEGTEPGEPGRGKAHRSYAERLDVPIGEGEPTPREVLERFDPVEAGLPEVTEEDAAEYITQNAGQRPWLAPAKDCDPSVQRVLVAIDRGQGHALERHEGYADDEKLQRRVTALEDPAQIDDDKRAAGIDGCTPGNKRHICGDVATAVQDPSAFAAMFARGVEHPRVGEALKTPYVVGDIPPKVVVSVKEILGSDGQDHCIGYALAPVDGSFDEARIRRSASVAARRTPDGASSVPRPECRPVESFEEAYTVFRFRPNANKDGYEISTMYIEP